MSIELWIQFHESRGVKSAVYYKEGVGIEDGKSIVDGNYKSSQGGSLRIRHAGHKCRDIQGCEMLHSQKYCAKLMQSLESAPFMVYEFSK